MARVFESKNFTVDIPKEPLVSRVDGGHIVINPKKRIADLQALSAEQAIELMRLLLVAGEAIQRVMANRGVDIGRMNYQDNGNWGVFTNEGPYQHFHLYGRAKSAITQPYGQALYFPHKNENPDFYKNLEPLHEKDIVEIRLKMLSLLASPKYSNLTWRLE